ncbi:hypothetical protein PGT21_032997 [Puccinia graminis f. sp. tritici]|uniref:DUF7918 domain-containing protein n=1 Tax=Puccinia graminis f. sp. tritici TaxID=56615 RepID=A0A5B0P1A7_PUCGR|nr:hypothetical protein PGTUg99_007955 [Puccinia graminis f. sp. tritici]KAA1094933.1 hypothetical protein PGT21_032997 [Puccinia graminis f. sp. tritici]
MPTNSASAARCTIKLITPPSSTSTKPTKTACQEYSQQSIKDPITGAFKEIVTIESKQSSRFQISFQVHHTAYDLLERTKPTCSSSTETDRALKSSDYLVEVLLDGISIGGYHQHRSQTPRPHNLNAFRSSETTTRLLEFAPLHLVDPDDFVQVLDHVAGNPTPEQMICQDEQIIRSLGTIELKITRCELSMKRRAPSIKQIRSRQTTNQMHFSEAIKKTRLSSTVGLGLPTLDERGKDKVSYRVNSKDRNPFLHFIFHYKPRSILIAEGILPASPIIPTELPGGGSSTEKQELERRSNWPETRITIDSSASESEKRESKADKINKKLEKKTAVDEKNEKEKVTDQLASGRRRKFDNCKKRGDEEEEEGNGEMDHQEKRGRVSPKTDQKPANPSTQTKLIINPSEPLINIDQDIKPAQPAILIDLTL